jgi:hypothetical protein
MTTNKPNRKSQPQKPANSGSNSTKGSAMYVVDEFGVVRQYNEWYQNETLGESHPQVSSHSHSPVFRHQKTKKPPKTTRLTKRSAKQTSSNKPSHSSRPLSSTESVEQSVPTAPNLNSHVQNQAREAVIVIENDGSQESSKLSSAVLQRIRNSPIPCPICLELVKPTEIHRHCIYNHPSKELFSLIREFLTQKLFCTACQNKVPVSHLVGHYLQRHAGMAFLGIEFRYITTNHVQNTPSKHNKINKKPTQPSVESPAAQRRAKLVDDYFDIVRNKLPIDEQYDDEPRDGSKGLGHFKREGGQFGSYPLHDDYDDESDAD